MIKHSLPIQMALVYSLLLPFCLATETEPKQSSIEIRVATDLKPRSVQIENAVDIGLCGKERTKSTLDIAPSGLLKGVVAILRGEKAVISDNEPVLINIKNCQLWPPMVKVAPNQILRFESEDPILYQLRFHSPKNGRKLLVIPPNLKSVETSLENREILTISDDIHAGVQMTIIVDDRAQLALPSPQGSIKFKSIYSGRYQLILWHDQLGSWDYPEPIQITESKVLEVKWPSNQ